MASIEELNTFTSKNYFIMKFTSDRMAIGHVVESLFVSIVCIGARFEPNLLSQEWKTLQCIFIAIPSIFINRPSKTTSIICK